MGKHIKITNRKITEINPAPYNPREITEHAFEGLKESIKKFGLIDPLIVNKRNGVLVGGHQRLKAAEALGYTEVPTVEVDLSPAEEKALNITLNNTKITGFFTDALQDLLEEIKFEFGDDEFTGLHLDELVIDDNWDGGMEDVEKTEENLSGITATIKVRCPQEIRDEVLIYLKAKFLEVSFEGVEVV